MINKRIGKRFTPALVARFDALCEQFPTSDACLSSLLDRANHAPSVAPSVSTVVDILTLVQCTDEERAMVEQALASSVVPWKQLFKTALLAEMRSRLKYAKKFDDLDLSDAKARHHIRGAGFARCREVLDQVIAANKNASTPAQRRYISPNLIAKLGGGISPALAIKFCQIYLDEIGAHNRAMGFFGINQGQIHNQWHTKKCTCLPQDEKMEKSQAQ